MADNWSPASAPPDGRPGAPGSTSGPVKPFGKPERQRLPAWSRESLVKVALLVSIGILVAIFGIASDGKEFLPVNLIQIVNASVVLGIAAVGEVMVMIAGALDISVGSTAGLVSAVVAVTMMHTGGNLAVGLVSGIATGILAGAVNGVAVAYFKINSVIATLGTFSAYAGLALLVTNGEQVGVPSAPLATVGTGSIGPVPYLVIISVIVVAIAMFGMRYTLWGHNAYAVGGNQTASQLAGIRVQRYHLGLFVLSGLCAGIAGIILVGQTGTAQPAEGSVGLELTAITAVLLGGTGLTGGTGNVLSAVLGVLVLGTLENGLLLVGVPSFWQQVATGVLLMVAVVLQDFTGHRDRIRNLLAARRRKAMVNSR